MARSNTPAEPKSPGRLKQMWQVFQMTRRYDKRAVWYIAGAVFAPIIVAVVVALIVSHGGVLNAVLWIIAGVLLGVLLGLLVLGRRAEHAAYSQIEGQAGAVGAVLRSSLRRGWVGSEMPVAVNGKTKDAVYRATGRGGVVLISEGSKASTARMLEEERRKVTRAVGNGVPISSLNVGPDEDAVPLHRLARRLTRIKPKLTKAEVLAVNNRLSSLEKSPLPIPKGMDPMRTRPQRVR